VGEPEALLELEQGVRLFERSEVAALNILHQADLEAAPVIHVLLVARDPSQSGLLGGAIAALPGDDLKAVSDLPDQDRLEDPFLLDRGHQLIDPLEAATRLVGTGVNLVEGDLAADGSRRPGREALDEVGVMAHVLGLWESSGLRHG
jgi:hypothetical protein